VKLFWKIFPLFFVLSVAGTLVTVVLVDRRVSKRERERIESELSAVNEAFAYRREEENAQLAKHVPFPFEQPYQRVLVDFGHANPKDLFLAIHPYFESIGHDRPDQFAAIYNLNDESPGPSLVYPGDGKGSPEHFAAIRSFLLEPAVESALPIDRVRAGETKMEGDPLVLDGRLVRPRGQDRRPEHLTLSMMLGTSVQIQMKTV
jgi:hypothetical protein